VVVLKAAVVCDSNFATSAETDVSVSHRAVAGLGLHAHSGMSMHISNPEHGTKPPGVELTSRVRLRDRGIACSRQEHGTCRDHDHVAEACGGIVHC